MGFEPLPGLRLSCKTDGFRVDIPTGSANGLNFLLVFLSVRLSTLV
jgi:hypothetical protein